MGLKRDSIEAVTWFLNAFAGYSAKSCPENPGSIFVLRNNDIGDLLVATPLFEALKRRFPQAKILAGIGTWNREVLANNPFVDEILNVNAPWHNQQVNPAGLLPAIRYLLGSDEVNQIRRYRFGIGIDVLGSPLGSLLMMKAKIPWRLGVNGYAGGHSGVQQFIRFDPAKHVSRAVLDFAILLGAKDLPEPRPQIYLTGDEKLDGEKRWSEAGKGKRIVVASGGGFAAKCWPADSFSALLSRIESTAPVLIGGAKDLPLAQEICEKNPHVRNLAGQLQLREVFSLIAAADAVICNSSMAMHVAAAFHKPSLVLLGKAFPSAHAHSRLWGYPESTLLGPEPDSPRIATVDQALSALNF